MLFHELLRPALPLVAAPGLAHPRPDEGQEVDRPDERVPLEKLLLLPQEPVQFAPVKRAEAAPQDEMLGRGDDGDGIDLEKTELPDRREHITRGPVEELSAHGDPPCLCEAEILGTHRVRTFATATAPGAGARGRVWAGRAGSGAGPGRLRGRRDRSGGARRPDLPADDDRGSQRARAVRRRRREPVPAPRPRPWRR